jgi:DNA-binding NarL/FixJ family response regulator
VKKAGLKTKVIILTMQNDAVTASRATNYGADGYLLKDCAYEELQNAIKTVLAGKLYVCSAIAADMEDYEARVLPKLSGLTQREKEILRLIAEGQTSREIGEDLCISIKTVETHRTNVMRKLHLDKKTIFLER